MGLDAIAYPGYEDNPRPTGASDPGRRNGSWRYAIQRFWRFAFWGYSRTVSIEAKVDALTSAVQELRAGQERILAAIEGRAPVELPPLTEVDVAPYLRVIAVDDPDGVADAVG